MKSNKFMASVDVISLFPEMKTDATANVMKETIINSEKISLLGLFVGINGLRPNTTIQSIKI